MTARISRTTAPFSFSMLVWLGATFFQAAVAQQIGDQSFTPVVENPAFGPGAGPTVLIDEAHFNYHTVDGRYKPFADLLRKDGYVVGAIQVSITTASLENVDVLVIANALSERQSVHWRLPSESAFSQEEIDILDSWVRSGGSLLLIADHMPFPGAVSSLAERFGVYVYDGFVDVVPDMSAPWDSLSSIVPFSKDLGTLMSHPITEGRNESETVSRVMMFTGQAFRMASRFEHSELMVLPGNARIWMPSNSWVNTDQTPRHRASGLLAGAAISVGMGKVAFFGEAAMFSAQSRGDQKLPMGMNHPDARDNAKFVLNTLHWLSGILN